MTIPLFKVFMAPEAKEELGKILDSGYIGQGPMCDKFEKDLATHFNNDCVATVNSCTSALELAIHMIKPEEGFSPEDEIITTPLTCFATIVPIIHNGARVKWADIDPNTCNLDLTDVRRKVGPNTRAIIVVHWGGSPVNMDELKSIQKDYLLEYGRPLEVIEDCAHCWSSKYKDQLIGNSGNYCCFSFQAIKFLTTGDGGALITPNIFLHKKAKLLRWFGLDRDSGASFRCIQDLKIVGYKYQTNDIAASIGICNLKHMDKVVGINKSNAHYYNENLKNIDGLKLIQQEEHAESSYWLYSIFVENRDKFINSLDKKGITTSPVHARCDKHTCVKQYKSMLPGMDSVENNYVSIPVGWWVTEEDREHIVKSIKEGW